MRLFRKLRYWFLSKQQKKAIYIANSLNFKPVISNYWTAVYLHYEVSVFIAGDLAVIKVFPIGGLGLEYGGKEIVPAVFLTNLSRVWPENRIDTVYSELMEGAANVR